jgi:hypothetical protein
MSTCVKRSVLGAGDRQAAITRAAAAVQAATQQLAQRVVPHAGSPLGSPRGVGMAIPHSMLGGYNPIQDALRNLGNAMNTFAREVNNALAQAARDAADARAVGAPGKVALRIVYQPYTEPMNIPWPDDEMAVAAVICARAVRTDGVVERLLNGSEIDFDFADNHQLKVNSIDGMTPDATKMITWTFVYFGV